MIDTLVLYLNESYHYIGITQEGFYLSLGELLFMNIFTLVVIIGFFYYDPIGKITFSQSFKDRYLNIFVAALAAVYVSSMYLSGHIIFLGVMMLMAIGIYIIETNDKYIWLREKLDDYF
ncbi:hypothetical protein JHD48_07820 [Sulfurimonas sp. SAG-AH-194-I05]|nr:hypothetical protein [Sulfurimonas sp. SAG-AH-194-I05]MDF1875638.1 hypothetical protein [Sulfurimonas sp. SAG-AH-194-I05]